MDGVEDAIILATLISDAMDGVDIAQRYPFFFRCLLADAELRAAFLDAVHILGGGEAAESERLPSPPSRDLSFLNKARPSSVDRPSPDIVVEPAGWKLRWKRSAEELATLFSLLSPDLDVAFRSISAFPEDETVTVLRGSMTSKEFDLDLTLDATRLAAKPDELQLTLWVLTANDADSTNPADAAPPLAFSLIARVKWGNYDEQIEIEGPARYSLPPRPISEIVDESGNVIGELTVSLRARRDD